MQGRNEHDLSFGRGLSGGLDVELNGWVGSKRNEIRLCVKCHCVFPGTLGREVGLGRHRPMSRHHR